MGIARSSPLWLVALVSAAACAEPPQKELSRAEGAIDTARAAGADDYAPDELDQADAALQRAEDAVGQRDYRLALGQALEAFDLAQQAARRAATEKALVRGRVEQAIGATSAALDATAQRVAGLAAGRAVDPRLTVLHPLMASAQQALQEAHSSVASEDFGQAQRHVGDVEAALRKAAEILDQRTPPPARRPR